MLEGPHGGRAKVTATCAKQLTTDHSQAMETVPEKDADSQAPHSEVPVH